MATKGKTQEGEDTAAQQPKPKKTPVVLIVVGALALIAAGGGGAYAWLKFMAPHRVEAKAEGGPPAAAKPGEKGQENAASAQKMGPIMDLDPFIVNLADPETRFLKITVKLEMDGLPAKTEAGERLPQVRDAVLVLLSAKDSPAIKSTAGKMQLRDEILARINSLLSAGQARNAYFTEFVVQ